MQFIEVEIFMFMSDYRALIASVKDRTCLTIAYSSTFSDQFSVACLLYLLKNQYWEEKPSDKI